MRLKTRANRGRYEHRVVIEKLLANPIALPYVFPERGVIPAGMTVEHVDHQRAHNCHGNLMLLDKRIHDKISWWTKKYFMEHYEEYCEMLQEKNRAEEERERDEVPF